MSKAARQELSKAFARGLRNLRDEQFIRVDGAGLKEESRRAMRAVLMKNRGAQRILVAPNNDTSALGALKAAQELRRAHQLAILGHDCIPEVLDEMKKKKPNSWFRLPRSGDLRAEIDSTRIVPGERGKCFSLQLRRAPVGKPLFELD